MTRIQDWLSEQGVKNTGAEDDLQQRPAPSEQPPLYQVVTYRNIVVPDGIPAIVSQDLFERECEGRLSQSHWPYKRMEKKRLTLPQAAGIMQVIDKFLSIKNKGGVCL